MASRDLDGSLKKELSSKLLHGTSVVFAGTMSDRFVILALNILLARVLGPEKYGLYVLGYILLLLVSKFSLLGLQTGLTRFNSIYIHDKDKERIKGTLILSFIFVALVSIFAASLLFFFAEAIGGIFFKNVNLANIIKAFSLALPFYTLTLISASAARAAKQMKYYVVSRFISISTINLVIASILFYCGYKLNGAIFAFFLAGIFSAAVGVYLTGKLYIPILAGSGKSIWEIKKLMRFSLPVVFTGASLYLLARLDRLMLGYFSVAREVGVYTAAASFTSLIGITGSPFSGIFGPMMAEKFHKGKLNEVSFLFQLVTRWIFIVALFITAILILFSVDILGFFYGDEYRTGSVILIFLCIARFISTATGHTGLMLSMGGKQDWQLFNTISCIVISIALNIWLIPIWGAKGAAIAMLVSICFLEIVKLAEVYIFWRLCPFNAKYFKPLISLASATTICYAFSRSVKSSYNNSMLILNILVFLSVYIVTYFLFKIDEEDYIIINYVRKLLRFRYKRKDD